MPAISTSHGLPADNKSLGLNHLYLAIAKQPAEWRRRRYSPLLQEELRKAAESMLNSELVLAHVKTWIKDGSKISSSEVLDLLSCIKNLVSIMRYSFERLLWPILLYAERFVAATIPIERCQLLPLLMVSASVAMKMWEDCGPDLNLLSFVCGISKHALSQLERVLLMTLDYKLFLDMVDIDAFKLAPVLDAARALAAGSQVESLPAHQQQPPLRGLQPTQLQSLQLTQLQSLLPPPSLQTLLPPLPLQSLQAPQFHSMLPPQLQIQQLQNLQMQQLQNLQPASAFGPLSAGFVLPTSGTRGVYAAPPNPWLQPRWTPANPNMPLAYRPVPLGIIPPGLDVYTGCL